MRREIYTHLDTIKIHIHLTWKFNADATTLDLDYLVDDVQLEVNYAMYVVT